MTMPTPQDPDAAPAGFDEIGLIEFDENIPPRPEEDVADAARAVPDRAVSDNDRPVRAPDGQPADSRLEDESPTGA